MFMRSFVKQSAGDCHFDQGRINIALLACPNTDFSFFILFYFIYLFIHLFAIYEIQCYANEFSRLIKKTFYEIQWLNNEFSRITKKTFPDIQWHDNEFSHLIKKTLF